MIVKTESDMSFVRHNFKPMKNKLLNKYSNAEEHFESLLKMTDMFYVREKGNFRYGTRWCYYDFYIPFYRIYIEIDGKSHDSAEQRLIDKEKQKIVEHKNRFLIRLSNEEVLGLNEISLCYLIKRLCEQRSEYSSRSFGFAINEYLENLTNNVYCGIHDMLEDTGIQVEENKDVFAYCKSTGRIYRFQNECIAKIGLNFSLSEIRKLLVNVNYEKKTSRKYVLAYSEEECIKRVKTCMGIDVEYNGDIVFSCMIDDLYPIMNDRERERWLDIPIPGVEEFTKKAEQLGFYVKNDKKKDRIEMGKDNFLYCYVDSNTHVTIRIFLSHDVLRFCLVQPERWYGEAYKLKDVLLNHEDLNSFIYYFIEKMCEKYKLSLKNKFSKHYGKDNKRKEA